MQHLDYHTIRLVKYSKLIDKAILYHKYSLATHLAYRCLLEYQRLFLRFLAPHSRAGRRNAFQLALLIARFMRYRRELTRQRTRQLFNLLRSTYYMTSLSGAYRGERDLHIDLATATFARDQAIAISQFLCGSIEEYRA